MTVDALRDVPAISIVMANFNNAPFVPVAIESVLRQGFVRWELLIVDDASTDASIEAIRPYLADPRIRLLRREKNGGYPAAQKSGISESNGEIVIILDPDDALVDDALQFTFEAHCAYPSVAVILSQQIICDSRLRPLEATTNTQEHLHDPLILLRNFTHLRTFKRHYYDAAMMSDQHRIACDWELILNLEERGGAVRVDHPLLLYRTHANSLSNSPLRFAATLSDFAWVIRRAHLRRRRSTIPNLPPLVVISFLQNSAIAERGAGRLWAALRLLLGAWSVKPSDFGVYRTLYSLVTSQHRRIGLPLSVKSFQSRTGNRNSDRIVCWESVHSPGHALFGGDWLCTAAGQASIVFDVRVLSSTHCAEEAVTIDVYENLQSNSVVIARFIPFKELRAGIELAFRMHLGERYEFRIYWHGKGVMEIRGGQLLLIPDKHSSDIS